ATGTGDSVEVWAALTREGNAAFIGSVSFALVTGAGETLQTWGPSPMAVYYGVNRRFALPIEAVPGGNYTIKLAISTARTDIPANVVLPAPPIEHRIPVTLP
ncbi:MAG: hypothetical protein OEW06_13245, partial [Gemmatimonadota bacterium]|nr:hypothetical protein [Gemmatimonadota bacterium]